MAKNLNYVKINSANPLYLIIDKINGYIEESHRNRYESKDILKQYEELWNKIRDLIRSIIKNSDNYDEKYMKIKTLKMLEIHNIIIVATLVFNEDNKYYPQVFPYNCLYKL